MDENMNMNETMNRTSDTNSWGMMFVGLFVGAFFGWLITWTIMMPKSTVLTPTVQTPVVTNTVTSGLNAKQMMLYQSMNKLWLEHVWWTREYLKSSANNSKDTAMVAARLIKNQEDIGNAIKPVYGDAAGTKLTTLLRTHIQGAVDLVSAVKIGSQSAIAAANTAWYENADQIATFLSTANPNWTQADLTTMMHTHLDLTKQEALDLIEKKDDIAITDFQKVEDEILMMSDSLSKGIIKQFPDKF